MKIVFLGIGTNLNNRENNLKEAVARIEEFIGKVVLSSSVYETEPWGFHSEDEFLNMVVKVETKLTSSGLLGRILMIESLLGRARGEKQYSSRVIDIDILLYENMVIDEISLKIPHPFMHERKFVLIPLCELAPEIVHPVLNKSIESLLKSCKDKSLVRKY
ncbi:MAG: 2-amino-4-hydroxy-6-hydroxymethyldihydropteridine diphosphokinase [Bacteroidota bacterium]